KDVDLKTNTLTFEHTRTKEKISHQFDYIFGADGAYSAVRNRLQKTKPFNYTQEYLTHGYKELHFPPTSGNDFCMDKNCLHIWPRGQFMMIALPNLDKSFTVTLFFPLEGETSFKTLSSPKKVQSFFQKTFPDALKHLPTLAEDFFS